MLEQTFWNIGQYFTRRSGINRNTVNSLNYQYLVDRPAWLSLSNASEYRKAVAENPVLFGCIDILASAASNGKKYLVDLNGNIVPWSSNKTGVKNARKLFVDRPNPLQSFGEHMYERYYMFFTFGNNYVYLNNPLESFPTDIATVQTMYSLPSEYMTVQQTGKIYDQVDVAGIISKYSLTNYNPAREFDPKDIIHFNDCNISNIGNSIIGSSRLESLKMPITNSQLCFEAMNVILNHRGPNGIIKANNKDGTGTQIPLGDSSKRDIDETFKSDYGLRKHQKQFLISYSDIDFIKTSQNPEELGIAKEFSRNAMIITNNFKIPNELYKTVLDGATFENQRQAERRLYQNAVIPMVDNEDQYYTERLKMRNYGFELRTSWEHIDCLQEGFREKATSLSMNSRSAELAYNNNTITFDEYRDLIGLKPIGTALGGDKYKFEMPERITAPQKVEPVAPDATQNTMQ